MLTRPALWRPALAAVLLLATGCTQSLGNEPGASDGLRPPKLGACRVLEPADVAASDNDTPAVDCTEQHTAETFAVGSFPERLRRGADVDDAGLGAYVYDTCSTRFQQFLGGDESTVMRSTLTWAWFRPSPEDWDRGARWYRCDVVGGTEESEALPTLPETAQGVLLGRPADSWMTCAVGETVADSVKVPCVQPHNWRAVTTIEVGRDDDGYPGDAVVEDRTRDFCSDSVRAWLSYPVDYEFGYTYFGEAEWEVGNRRSICWARTDQ